MADRPVFNFPRETFDYHRPDDEQLERVTAVRDLFRDLRAQLEAHLRPGSCSGRYAALGGTALEEACMWCIKAIVFERYNEVRNGG